MAFLEGIKAVFLEVKKRRVAPVCANRRWRRRTIFFLSTHAPKERMGRYRLFILQRGSTAATKVAKEFL